MPLYAPTRDPLIINRRRLIGFLTGAVAAGIISRGEALAYLQDASQKTGVDPTQVEPGDDQGPGGHPRGRYGRRAARAGAGDDGRDDPVLERRADRGVAQISTGTCTTSSWPPSPRYYPSITLDNQNIGYNDLLDKIRTAAAGGAAPDVAKLPILWGVEFAARGDTSEITLEEFGWTAEQFWPGALKSVTWDGKLYGVPTNNETMAFIWNKQIFADAGLDPENAAGDLGRRGRLLEADQGRDRQERLRHGLPRSTPATPPSASCR